ncbi:MAG: amidohydrolase [Clostridia bacterium]|nr:amidohydrolase [Clostridia bacterium]
MTDYLSEANQIAAELTALRREFHRRPELGNREFQTAARIEDDLRGLNIPTRRLLDTAVVGVLEGGLPGKTVALRADMDALPLTEATGADFASQNPGVMHACGHDVHMAAALGAARLLAARRDSLPGKVIFLFQPDEEGRGGAQRMIEAGALEGVDAVFGAHVSPELPLGTVGVRYGKFYAASDTFRIVVRGKSAHGAEREKGVDALGAAADLVGRLIALPKAAIPGERAVVSVGMLRGGTAENALADRAELAGIMRTLGPQARAELKRRFRETLDAAMADWSATAEVELRESYPGVVNDDAMTALAERAARDLLGAARVRVIEWPTMTTEDFGYFLMARPGTFYHIGAGCALPLHNMAFLPDERAAIVGAATHAAVIEAFLRT